MALPRRVVSRCATAWAESLEGQSWALLCRYRCRLLLAEIPKCVDRNSELKLRLHLWETGQISDLICKVLGQQNSGMLRRTARRVPPQTDEQRPKRACALTARASISKAMKGLVGGAAQGSADRRRNWTTLLIPRSSGIGTHPTSAECAEAARIAWGGGRYRAARAAMREQGCEVSKNSSQESVKSIPQNQMSGRMCEQIQVVEAPETARQDRRLQRTVEALVDRVEAAQIALQQRISERMHEQFGVIEVSKNSSQENVETVKILLQRSDCLDGRVNRSGFSNYPGSHSKKVLK